MSKYITYENLSNFKKLDDILYVKKSDLGTSISSSDIADMFALEYATVTINTVEGATVTVTCNDNTYTATFNEVVDKDWTATVTEGYTLDNTAGKVGDGKSITATKNA